MSNGNAEKAGLPPETEADESASSHPATPQDGAVANYTPKQEARVVSKVDCNLMTLFFVLCE